MPFTIGLVSLSPQRHFLESFERKPIMVAVCTEVLIGKQLDLGDMLAAPHMLLTSCLAMPCTQQMRAGVSMQVGNMAYMTRLGLWGPGSAFPDFDAFLDSMKRRGVSFMEMLAMEMKAEGNYVARGLSFR